MSSMATVKQSDFRRDPRAWLERAKDEDVVVTDDAGYPRMIIASPRPIPVCRACGQYLERDDNPSDVDSEDHHGW
jgi:hypothetical protein